MQFGTSGPVLVVTSGFFCVASRRLEFGSKMVEIYELPPLGSRILARRSISAVLAPVGAWIISMSSMVLLVPSVIRRIGIGTPGSKGPGPPYKSCRAPTNAAPIRSGLIPKIARPPVNSIVSLVIIDVFRAVKRRQHDYRLIRGTLKKWLERTNEIELFPSLFFRIVLLGYV